MGNFFETLRFPVDERTPFGYLIAGSIEVVSNTTAAIMFAISLGINFGICSFLSDFVSDLEENLRQLDQQYITAKINKELTIEKRIEMNRNFLDIIQFHAEARELSLRFRKRKFKF